MTAPAPSAKRCFVVWIVPSFKSAARRSLAACRQAAGYSRRRGEPRTRPVGRRKEQLVALSNGFPSCAPSVGQRSYFFPASSIRGRAMPATHPPAPASVRGRPPLSTASAEQGRLAGNLWRLASSVTRTRFGTENALCRGDEAFDALPGSSLERRRKVIGGARAPCLACLSHLQESSWRLASSCPSALISQTPHEVLWRSLV